MSGKNAQTYQLIRFEGDRNKPLCIFIHGMGMNASMWADPENARILGGTYPLSILLHKREMETSYHDLKDHGFPLLAWSQKRPAGAAMAAVAELQDIVAEYSSMSLLGIVLIGHSRGGLIARKFLQHSNAMILGIITIGTPHKGSSMAKWAEYISPLTTLVRKLMDVRDNDVKTAAHRIVAFLEGEGIKEMLPGSDFITGLSTEKGPQIPAVSVGGTDPEFVRFGNASLPKLLSMIIPEHSIPDELREGRGDGLVSISSAVYPGGEHRNYHAHHAGLLFDPKVRAYILDVMTSLVA